MKILPFNFQSIAASKEGTMSSRRTKMRFLSKSTIFSIIALLQVLSIFPNLTYSQEARLVVKDVTGSADVFTVTDEGYVSATKALLGEMATPERAARVFNMVGNAGGIRNWRIHDSWPPFVELISSKPSAPDTIVSYWDFSAGLQYGPNMFWIRDRTNWIDAIRFSIAGNGNVGIGLGNVAASYLLQLKGGAYSNGSTWVNASSRELKKDIKELESDEAIEALKKLNPVRFAYKADESGEKYIGFIAEDVPDLVATNDRKGLDTMDIVAVLTKVLQEQQKTIAMLSKQVADLEQKSRTR